jgi:hypothetical protein
MTFASLQGNSESLPEVMTNVRVGECVQKEETAKSAGRFEAQRTKQKGATAGSHPNSKCGVGMPHTLLNTSGSRNSALSRESNKTIY